MEKKLSKGLHNSFHKWKKTNAIYFDSVEAFILKKTSSYFLQNKRIFTLQTLVDLGSDLRDNVYASVRKKEN